MSHRRRWKDTVEKKKEVPPQLDALRVNEADDSPFVSPMDAYQVWCVTRCKSVNGPVNWFLGPLMERSMFQMMSLRWQLQWMDAQLEKVKGKN